MLKILPIIALVILCITVTATDAMARGGFSSGGSRGGFSSASRPSMSTLSRPSTYVRTTTTSNRTYSSANYYGGYGHPMYMGGMGMGYGYSNGLIEGMILGHLMFPQGTQVYNGGGYVGNALLLPDGRVADQNGNQVGIYANGKFVPQQGGMIAQPAPPPPTDTDDSPSAGDVIAVIVIAVLIILIIILS